LVGSLGGFNQNSIKKILTYSSIIHSAWMLSVILFRKEIWAKYFLIYTIITIAIILILIFNRINRIKKIIIFHGDKLIKIRFLTIILSLGGLPPFLGFLAKFIAARNLIYNIFSWIILFILICASLIALFFYCKLAYISLITSNIKINFIKKTTPNKKLITVWVYLSITLNIIFPSLVLLA